MSKVRDQEKKSPRRLLLPIIVIVTFEFLIRLLVGVGLVPYQQFPTGPLPVFWDDINEEVGVWHLPNGQFQLQKACFNVEYTSNSIGARDRERTRAQSGDQRFVVLGDSFVEGYGVEAQDRFSDRLESEMEIEFLNFGTSGHFGSIQEWILYRSLASGFEHTDLLLMILPENDFRDNRRDGFSDRRYRPYLRQTNEGYEVYYTVPFAERERREQSMGTRIRNAIQNKVYLLNVLRQVTHQIRHRRDRAEDGRNHKGSGYQRFDKDDLDVLLYTLDEIVKESDGRRVWIATLPVRSDFDIQAEAGSPLALERELQEFADRHPQTHYLDLGEPLRDRSRRENLDLDDLFLSCDPHWSPDGHRLVAEVLREWFLTPGSGR